MARINPLFNVDPNINTFLNSPTSLNLANAVTDETGTGNLLFSYSPLITAANASSVGLIIQGAASQSSDLQQWQNSSGGVLASITYNGQVGSVNNGTFGSLTPYGRLTSFPAASQIGLVIRGAASQTANLTEWQNSSGTVQASMSAGGSLSATSGYISTLYAGSGISGGTLGLFNASPFNATQVPAVIRGFASQSADLFEIQDSAGNKLNWVDQYGRQRIGTTNSGAFTLNISPFSASDVGINIRGISSQTGDLQQWQNSAGTVGAKVDSSSNIFANSYFGLTGTINYPNVFGMLYTGGAPSAYAEGSLSTNAGFSTPVMLPNEEGYYPYWGFKTPNIVETSADGTTWTVVDPTGYRSLFAFQNGSYVNITTRFLRITFYQPVYTFLALMSARFVGGTNNKPITMKTELLGSDYSTIIATHGPTGGAVAYDGSALMQKFNSYNGSTYATRVTFDMALWSAGDTYQISSLMAYMSKPGTGFGFQNKFPMLWDVSKTTTFQPSHPGARGVIVKAATTLTSTITNAVANGTTITYTTSSQHGFLSGYTISITGIVSTGNPSATAGSGFNLTGATIAAVLNQTQFTVTNSLTDTYTSGGTLSVGQGANLTEWQNSAGTVLSSVNATGTVFAPYFRVGNYIIDNADTGATLNFNANGTNSSSIIATARSATQVPLQVKAAASQTADLQRWTDSSGTTLSLVNSSGSFRVASIGAIASGNAALTPGGDTNGFLLATVNPGNKGLVVRGSASQTATLLELQTSDGVLQSSFSPIGYLQIGAGTSAGGQLGITLGGATNRGIVIRAAASQTANLQEWQDSAGTLNTVINNGGGIATSNRLHIGGTTTVSGVKSQISNATATDIALVVKGAASQSANLTEWQNSAGTVLSNVTSGGIIRSTLSMQALGMQSVSDGSQSMAFSSNRNVQIGSTTGVYGGGQGVIGITNMTTAPTSNPTGGGILYVDTGALKYLGTSGSAQTIVSADGTVNHSGALTATGDISTSGWLYSNASSGDEGGQIVLEKPVTNTTLASSIVIDIYQNKLRFFEYGGTNRGYYIDLTTGGTNAGTNLVGGGGGSGTVTSVSVVSANGFAGTVATSTTTPAITLSTTITGLLKGNGTAISAATAGTDYLVPSGSANISTSGTITSTNTTASTSTTTGAIVSSGGIGAAGTVTADQFNATNNGNGTNYKVGDDIWLGDVNIANTLAVKGQQNSSIGYIRFGGDTNGFGYDGTKLTYAGTFTLTGALNLAAGTTSLSPLTFQSGTNLATVTSGAREYDGTVFYQTSNTTPGRALDTQQYYYASSSDYGPDFTSSGAVKSMLGGSTTGITLAAGTTYEYEFYTTVQHQYVTNTGVTGTYAITSSTVSGSPTVAVTHQVDYGSNTTNFTTATTLSTVRTTGSVTFSAAISSGSRYNFLRAKGIIRVTGTGTAKIYPGLSTSQVGASDNVWTVQSGTVFKLTPIGNGTVTTVGAFA